MIAPLPHGEHARTASREEDIIWSLRTQLAFKQELCTQYEIDLGARDELVQALTSRLENTDRENDKRKNILRSWKKKVAELEKMCRNLEEEVDNSRQESLERSIMDEASGEALRQLHRQISQLEREKADIEVNGVALRNQRDTLQVAMKDMEEELAKLKQDLESRTDDEQEGASKVREQEMVIEALQDDVKALEGKILAMEEDWNEGENNKHALEAELQEALEVRNSLETERDQLNEQLDQERNHVDGLTQSLQEQEDRFIQLDEELQSTKETVTRLEERIQMRDDEIFSLSEQVRRSTSEADELQGELSSLKREQTRNSDNQKREVEDALSREKQAREQLEEALQEKAKSDIMLGSSKERVDSLTDEVARLRSQVHQLQQESADKEVKVLQLTKQHAQDKEDINGLNIALDSKQQELELVKRRLGVRSSTATPASSSKPPSRRESSAFATPSTAPRPPSALSDVSKDGSERKVTGTPSGAPRASISALNKSIRSNATGSITSKASGNMGPPPPRASRLSISATPTPPPVRVQSALGRSSNTRPSVSGTPSGGMRRASVSSIGTASQATPAKTPIRRPSAGSTSASADEKENLSLTPNALRTPRRPPLPA